MSGARIVWTALAALGIVCVTSDSARAACGWASNLTANAGVSVPFGRTSEYLTPMPGAEVGVGGACARVGVGGFAVVSAQFLLPAAPATRYWYLTTWLRPEVRVVEGLFLRLGLGAVRREIALPDAPETVYFPAGSVGWELRRSIRSANLSATFSYDVALSRNRHGYEQVRLGLGWLHRF